MNIHQDVFLRSARHVQEERQRLERMPDDKARGTCGGTIGLDSGIVHIRIGPTTAAPARRPRGPNASP
ncbi:DUF6191 domain-containing protein [Streptomyces sp. NPDC001351]|uniref:DUF6191 domain-containing protein n=1 Tax=Streptomyces sp. NPDC001351 TaxID=3364564 RepID=UPI0036914D3D